MNKKSRLTILIVTVVVLLVAGGGFWWYFQGANQRKAETVANDYLAHLEKGEYEQLTSLLTDNSIKKNGYTNQEILQKYQAIFSAIGATDVKASDVEVTKADKGFKLSYHLSLETTFGRLEDLAYDTTIQVDEDSKIDWSPSLIFPKMTGKDKVSVQEDPATRGEIVDRNGKPLATQREFQQLGLNPSKLGKGEQRSKNLEEISEEFSVSVERLEEALAPEWATGDVFVPIKTLYGDAEKTPLDTIPEGAVLGKESRRYYPLKEATAHLIGYVSQVTQEDIEKNPTLSETDIIGKSGLEAALDKQLRGESGGSITITDEKGNEKEVLIAREKKNPEPIKLAIDATVQQTAYDNLAGKPGSTVIMQPQTGELLATASSPSYDPNQMMLGMSQKEYDAYANDENLPFLARFTNRYAPGSTFKVITAAIGLDDKVISPEEALDISGLKWQKDESWGSYEVTRVKEASPINLEKALVYSDNIYFAQKTLDLGEDKFRAGLDKFIFGEEFDLPLHMEPASISNEDSFASDILLADTGYGQGELLISPIQQATMYSVFMNDGQLVYPRLLSTDEKKVKDDVVSKNAVDTILDDLVHSVSDEDGYVHSLYNPNFVLAAKTGTAEIKEKQDTTGLENSFLLYFDKENKEFMGVTMVENSRENGTAIERSGDVIQALENPE
ncbi:penicillin-binding transpeptidase domain-containing protein [Candidatus Enterococcus willemsii]|uniref:penicillin-binding protein PBP4(5) n=1 Tax=Candidatus Enterococcus willemsii TaxID=1857215 RepID=UPI0013795FED|nr:penicillin-binding transpeptidase domain-containing protein [Enterococcus sp. CU12B]